MKSLTTVTFTYHTDHLPVRDLYVVGSWNESGTFDTKWTHRGIPMAPQRDGHYQATFKLDANSADTFFWGAKDVDGHWMFFEHSAIAFSPRKEPKQSFRLGGREEMGLHRDGEDGLRCRVWAPHATNCHLVILGEGNDQHLKMQRRGEYFDLRSSTGWAQAKGHPYGFEFLTSCGQIILRADPYAHIRQGPQRGVTDLFLTSQGEYTHRYQLDAGSFRGLRFEAQPQTEANPILRLYSGRRQLSQRALLRKFPQLQALPEMETWWSSVVLPNGDIPLVKRADVNAFAICIGPERATRNLRYEIVDEHGLTYHDRWDDTLDGHHNWSRLGIVAERCRNSMRRPAPSVPDVVFYEAHVGSLLGGGGNLRTSNFGDLEKILPKLDSLGFSALALMPTNATEGFRDWGYLGTSTMAHHEPYARPGRNAAESLLTLIDRAHSLQLKVFTDVVYNHVGGFHNDLWEFDGIENCWFERAARPTPMPGILRNRPFEDSEAKPRTLEQSVRGTPWGSIPAYNKKAVSQFYIDHAMDQIERFEFDGIRFDFTNLIHAPGHGDQEGWRMLRAIHRRLAYFYPEVLTFAEEFPPHPIITEQVENGGAGFSGLWNTEHQHRLIFTHGRPSVLQRMVEDRRPPLSYLLEHIVAPQGFGDSSRSATVLSNHDEVGNAQRIYHLVKNHPRGFDMAHLVCAFSLLCPGYPILFQGTEDLAANYFSWGLPHTWDGESHFDHLLPDYREEHLAVIRATLKLRSKEKELWAHSPVLEHLIDEKKDLLGLRRGSFWIVGNFGPKTQTVPGQLSKYYRPCFTLERKAFGYQGRKSRGSRVGSYSLKVWRRKVEG